MRFTYSIILFFISINLANSLVLVGPSDQLTNCQFQTVQAALDSGDPEIRVVNGDYIENLNINHSVSIKAGYGSCFTASLNITLDGSKAVLDGSFLAGAPVINIAGISSLIVNLDNFTIKNAVDTQFTDGGHGIDLNNTTGSLTIKNSLIIGNTAENGGGIYSANPTGSLSVVIESSAVFGNSASLQGGGIYCGGSNTVIRVTNQSLIGENMAEDGGGIAAFNGCSIIVDSGIDVFNSMDLRGVLNNNASNNGGGIYLDAAELLLEGNVYTILNYGNNTDPVSVSNNIAGNAGGGIYARNSSIIDITDAQISGNSSTNNGGGIFLSTESNFIMQTSGENCWQPGKCSVLSHNLSGIDKLGGAINISSNSIANINNTHIYNNRAGFGAAVYAFDTGSSVRSIVTLDGNTIYKNADNGNNGFLDRYIIRSSGFIDFTIIHNTITGNDIDDSSTVIGINGMTDLNIKNSIIDNGDELILTTTGSSASVSIDCVAVNENGTIAGSPLGNVAVGYVDENNNDYRLSAQSPVRDSCADAGGLLTDGENEFRGWDDPGISNLSGTYDAGSDESYLSDIIFTNSFE